MLRQVAPALIAGLLSGLGSSVEAQLDGVYLDLSEVADSGTYIVYRYALSNPPTAKWSIALVEVDVGASEGTPPSLPATGRFLNAAAALPGEPHAEVGPISPEGWSASLSVGAELSWYPPSTGSSTSDRVGAGETKEGFGIRSSYLPGLTVVTAEPTVEDCCLVIPPDADGAFYPSRSSFSVTGLAVVPRFKPSEVTPQLLQAELSALCDSVLWLESTALCAEFDTLLSLAIEDASSGSGALEPLQRLAARVDERAAELGPNAYWLLKLNATQALERIR